MHHRAHQRQDRINGRQRSDNAEPEDAPGLAHTKRIEQESFEPEAFVLRRSMPWADEDGEGLVLVAFGHDLRAYGAQSGRMVGLEDGVPDALFRFAHPIPGGLLLVSSCARRPLRSRCAWCGWWSPGMVSRQVRKGTQATRLIEAHAGRLEERADDFAARDHSPVLISDPCLQERCAPSGPLRVDANRLGVRAMIRAWERPSRYSEGRPSRGACPCVYCSTWMQTALAWKVRRLSPWFSSLTNQSSPVAPLGELEFTWNRCLLNFALTA